MGSKAFNSTGPSFAPTIFWAGLVLPTSSVSVAFVNLGNFLAELQDFVPWPRHSLLLTDNNPEWRTPDESYEKAAEYAFYAAHASGLPGVDAPQQLRDDALALHRHMCDKMGQDADEELAQLQSGLARLQLPIVGL